MTGPGDRGGAAGEAVLSKKRARLGIIDEIERRCGEGALPVVRLLAEIDFELTSPDSAGGPGVGSGGRQRVKSLDEQIDLILPRV